MPYKEIQTAMGMIGQGNLARFLKNGGLERTRRDFPKLTPCKLQAGHISARNSGNGRFLWN